MEDACTKQRECTRRWGGNCRIIQRRLASLQAVETLADMSSVPGRCHALRGDLAGRFALDLWGPHRLVIEPANDPIPAKSDGGIDIGRVTAVRIVEVLDYHGD
jgi:proteic killer suppression protein